jgi:Ca2+-binding EF-hand superfamily protein
METAFKMIDRNASGGIQIDELKETFRCTEDTDQHDILWK